MNHPTLHPLVLVLATLAACITPTPPPTNGPPTATAPSSRSPTSQATPRPRPTATLSDVDTFLYKAPNNIRVMTYNVNWDSIFPEDDPMNHELRAFNRVESFGRIMRALRPDVLCLQEINDRRSPQALADFLTQVMGSGQDQRWQVASVRDDVIATRFELIEEGFGLVTRSVLPTLSQAAALVDLPNAAFGPNDLYVVCAHFKSGGGLGDILLRGRQADVIMAHVRDFETPGGSLDLLAGTPFIIMGDFNAYDTDPALHLRTLAQGDIYNENSYGEDVYPDWDGTALTDVMPRHNGRGTDNYTWRNDAEPFNPRALDRVIYSDSALQLENEFVLNTTLLADEVLAAHDLERDDVVLDRKSGNFDHLPVVVDFRVIESP